MDYSSLGTSNKRKETEEDHLHLRSMMQERWKYVRDYCKTPHEEIRSRQLDRIKELVRHAFDTVPLYRRKYSAAGFEPDDLKDWGDFESLPILTKQELIRAFPNESISALHTTEFTTRSSGSSGQFATLAVSPDAIYEDTLQGARQFFFQSGGKYGPDDIAMFIYTSPWWVTSIDGSYRAEFVPATAPVSEAIGKIKQVRPKVLSLYPSYLKQLATNSADMKGSGIELIVTHSEQSAPFERASLSKFFGVPVLDEFSSEELTRIALECPYGRYHLEEDACYIEIVDQKIPEKKLGLRQEGLVVGTNLLNEATPIIKYCQEDIAAILDQARCRCGSNFRILGQPKGRRMDGITTTSGDIIPSGSFLDMAYNWFLELGILTHGLKYQIVQDELGKVDVYISPGLYSFEEKDSESIRESMFRLLPRSMTVDIHVVKEIPTTGAKHRPVISKFTAGRL